MKKILFFKITKYSGFVSCVTQDVRYISSTNPDKSFRAEKKIASEMRDTHFDTSARVTRIIERFEKKAIQDSFRLDPIKFERLTRDTLVNRRGLP